MATASFQRAVQWSAGDTPQVRSPTFQIWLNLVATRSDFVEEALHSLANLSGSLTVTTRVDGEIAAVKMIIAQNGEVEGYDNLVCDSLI
jgi:hypothetical protein